MYFEFRVLEVGKGNGMFNISKKTKNLFRALMNRCAIGPGGIIFKSFIGYNFSKIFSSF
jgi:hypothetical protein